MTSVLDQGWASDYDAWDSLGAIGELGRPRVPAAIAPDPTPGYPVSGAPQQISTANQIQQDAAALRELGYPAPITGNAYDPKFMAEVAQFQRDVSPRAGIVDGLIGPTTRSVLQSELSQRAGAGGDPFGPVAAPAPPFTPSPATFPGAAPKSPAVVTAAAKDEDPTMLYVGIGAGVLALAGVVYYVTR